MHSSGIDYSASRNSSQSDRKGISLSGTIQTYIYTMLIHSILLEPSLFAPEKVFSPVDSLQVVITAYCMKNL